MQAMVLQSHGHRREPVGPDRVPAPVPGPGNYSCMSTYAVCVHGLQTVEGELELPKLR